MAERPRLPKLPLIVQAAIDDAREEAVRVLAGSRMLFDETTVDPISPLFQAEPKPAAFMHQLRVYAKTLFNAEAMFYRKCAKDGTELRDWLIDLAPCAKSDILRRLQPFTAIHDFHCTAEQRSEAIDDALRECVKLQTLLFSGDKISIPEEDQHPQDIPAPGPEGVGPDIKAERKKLRDDYKAECKLCGEQVNHPIIAHGSNPRWHSRTQIDKWLACDLRYNGEHDRLIRRFLTSETKRLRETRLKKLHA
jgi:hypothetical protein